MNLRNCILFFLLLSCNLVRAQQAPGYFGKRLSLDYGYSFFPALSNPNVGSAEDGASINSRNSLGVNFVNTRRKSIGLNVEWIKTQCLYYMNNSRRQDVSAIFISFDSRRYFNKQIAPIGSYFSYKLFYSQFWMSNAQKTVFTPFDTFGGAIAFGRQYVFFKRLLFNYELQMGLFPPNPDTFNEYVDQKTVSERVKDEASLRLTSHYAINFKFGLGYLIF